jgi:transposase InsO family protein
MTKPLHLSISGEALFRFAVLSQVLAKTGQGEDRADAVAAVAALKHADTSGSKRKVSDRSIYRWLSAYEKGGIAGLEPAHRARSRTSQVLPEALLDFLMLEKQQDDSASIPELIRRAREHGVVKPAEAVERSTVYRVLKRRGLRMTRRRRAKDRDSRRFAYPHRMDMVLCDGKHFRAGAQRQKRLALFYLDNATRLGLHVVVGTSETAELFQRGLYECICKFGLMTALYMDQGPGFIAEDTLTVVARLGVLLIHGEAGYPEGRGAIERFNRTAAADILRGLDGRPDVDPGRGALELRLQHYLNEVYAHRPHEGLAGETPWQRFDGDQRPLRFPKDDHDLRRNFEVYIERRVSNDHVVSVDAVDYEMPTGYAGQKIVLRRRLLDQGLGFLHEGRIIDLQPVDLAANARARRAKGKSPQPDTQPVPRPSAADLKFQRDFGPIVGADGGFDDLDGPSIDDPGYEEIPW